jgi:serine/threonine-protein kinase
MFNSSSKQESLPGYKILGKLGAGGMGLVVKAKEVRNNRIIAIKIIYPKTVKMPSLFRSFRTEADLLIKFNHPNIVKGYYVTPPEGINGLHYLVMEFVEGETVQELIDKTQQDKEDAIGINEELSLLIIMQVAGALEYLHTQNIVHRDVKPDNLLLDKKKGIVKLCDLGLAKGVTEQAKEQSTTFGTIAYMSPEQARGQGGLDIRSDIYSLGATLYHMITGKTPFAGTNDLEVMAKQVLSNIQSDEIKNKNFSPLVLYFIEKMMAKEKEIRYQTPRKVIEDIRSQIDGYRSLEFHPE